MKRDLEVVLVDDEKPITELLGTFIPLVTQGVHICAFNDSVVAKEYIATHVVDVVIADYKMPRLNGLQLMEAAPAHAKKVLMSGFASEIGNDKLQELHATFFEKPLFLPALAEVLTDQQNKIP